MAPIKQEVKTDKAPGPPMPGIYSQAVISNGMVYCSGSVGLDPATNKMVEGTVADRTKQCLANLTNILEAAGTSLENVVKCNVFLSDMSNFTAMNEVYVKYFGDVKPCRTCVAAYQLPLGTDVEIECIAALP
ncbi:endoribonuclease L-PSP [Polychaeton citri CBS 116435]|uniref:Endoribonuclease L-PSP n=1 Tax=Polychaeton citri CBS 116435 TaxID=1314669 RepID=A0A9P4ULU7_9PEZI|nr:endoribonuclease L-PSP [Polychaeton citri CBS 116435]